MDTSLRLTGALYSIVLWVNIISLLLWTISTLRIAFSRVIPVDRQKVLLATAGMFIVIALATFAILGTLSGSFCFLLLSTALFGAVSGFISRLRK